MRIVVKDFSRSRVSGALGLGAATLSIERSIPVGHGRREDDFGSFASVSKDAASTWTTTTTSRPSRPTINRPPEAWRVGAGADASTEVPELSLEDEEAIDRMIELSRPSDRIGAESAEAWASRLLRGAGADVKTRDVVERSGVDSDLARALLEASLAQARERTERRARIASVSMRLQRTLS